MQLVFSLRVIKKLNSSDFFGTTHPRTNLTAVVKKAKIKVL